MYTSIKHYIRNLCFFIVSFLSVSFLFGVIYFAQSSWWCVCVCTVYKIRKSVSRSFAVGNVVIYRNIGGNVGTMDRSRPEELSLFVLYTVLDFVFFPFLVNATTVATRKQLFFKFIYFLFLWKRWKSFPLGFFFPLMPGVIEIQLYTPCI